MAHTKPTEPVPIFPQDGNGGDAVHLGESISKRAG
jgi:hypothetical protein